MVYSLKSKFSGLFQTEGTLSQKAARGGVWVFGSFLFSKVLFFIRTIILVRLLTPEDFGLMGICYVAIGAMAVFTETGFNQALIQRKEHSDDTLNTAWIISILRGLVLFLLLFFLSPLVASFYNNPQIEPILKVIAVSFLFTGFTNIGLILYTKELNFKKRVVYDQATAILSIIVTVALAYWLRNVWALVLGQVAGALIGMSLSYWAHTFRPKFRFRPDIAKELFHFGKYVFLSGVIIFLITQGDDALVGKVLGMSALGFYLLAYRLSNLPATAITHVISQVSFPAYSKVQDDVKRLRLAYNKVLRFTLTLSLPIAMGLFILAPEFIRIVYGEKWLPMVSAMRVLCIFGAIRSFGATTGPLYQSVGRPSIVTRITFFQLLIMTAIIFPLTKKLDILGASLAVTIPITLANIWAAREVLNITRENCINFMRNISIPTFSSLIMGILLYLIKVNFINAITVAKLLFLILGGAIFYFSVLLLINRTILSESKFLLKSVFEK